MQAAVALEVFRTCDRDAGINTPLLQLGSSQPHSGWHPLPVINIESNTVPALVQLPFQGPAFRCSLRSPTMSTLRRHACLDPFNKRVKYHYVHHLPVPQSLMGYPGISCSYNFSRFVLRLPLSAHMSAHVTKLLRHDGKCSRFLW
jgi:hypothetical protein